MLDAYDTLTKDFGEPTVLFLEEGMGGTTLLFTAAARFPGEYLMVNITGIYYIAEHLPNGCGEINLNEDLRARIPEIIDAGVREAFTGRVPFS